MTDKTFSQSNKIDQQANNQTQQTKKQTNHIAEVGKMELISRQEALYAIYGICNEPVAWLIRAAREIEKLPPAQPEDCSTCKHGHFSDRQCDYCGVRYPSHYERDENE